MTADEGRGNLTGLYSKPSSSPTMYSRSMKGSLMATISTFLEVKAALVTRRPMRPNLKSKWWCLCVCLFLSLASRWCYDTTWVWLKPVGDASQSLDHYDHWAPDASNNQSWGCKIQFLTLSLNMACTTLLLWICVSLFVWDAYLLRRPETTAENKGQGSGGGAEGGVRSHTPFWGLKSKSTSSVVILVTAMQVA